METLQAGYPSAIAFAQLRWGDRLNMLQRCAVVLVGNVLYIANSDALIQLPYAEGQTQITATPRKVVAFPPGPMNHHWTKSLIASADGTRVYVGVGSNSNVAEHGTEKEEGRAAIWEIDTRTGTHRIFCLGTAESGWTGVGAGDRRVMGRAERSVSFAWR